MNRARNLCPSLIQTFYENLQSMYNQSGYSPFHIWNVDESGANASRNGIGKVFASKNLRNIHILTPNEESG